VPRTITLAALHGSGSGPKREWRPSSWHTSAVEVTPEVPVAEPDRPPMTHCGSSRCIAAALNDPGQLCGHRQIRGHNSRTCTDGGKYACLRIIMHRVRKFGSEVRSRTSATPTSAAQLSTRCTAMTGTSWCSALPSGRTRRPLPIASTDTGGPQSTGSR
jgi:hypothetical protein